MAVGDGQTLVRSCDLGWPLLLFFAAVLACDIAAAQTMYQYRGENGEWIFSDRPPDGGQDIETRSITSRMARGESTVTHAFTGNSVEVSVRNTFFAPMEVELDFASIVGVHYPDPDQQLVWVVPAHRESVLLDLAVLSGPAVQRNMRGRVDSLPSVFRGADGSRVPPSSGRTLSAYP